MLRGIGKFMLCAALALALGGLAAPTAYAACGCGKCAVKKHKGCNKCGHKKCGGMCGCECLPQWRGDQGVGGYHLDLGCADACCFQPPCEEQVCVDGWDLCQKWCDGMIHHPYELVYNGNGMLCDTGCCSAFIAGKRRGVICRTAVKEHKDACGCVQCCPETTCADIERPRTIPWWFNPGKGNIYLDENGNPVCGQVLPPKEAPPIQPPAEVAPPPTPPAPPEPPAPPQPPAPPVEIEVLPPDGGNG